MYNVGSLINGNKYKYDNNVGSNVTNIPPKTKYSLDKRMFSPNNKVAAAAEKIALELNDIDNYAFYYSVAKNMGAMRSIQLLHEVKADITNSRGKKNEIKYPKRFFTWKYKQLKNSVLP